MTARRAFVSYTLRCGTYDRVYLQAVDKALRVVGLAPYVDLIHNDSRDPQGRVMDELSSADMFVELCSVGYALSPWAQVESDAAAAWGLPRLRLAQRTGLWTISCGVARNHRE